MTKERREDLVVLAVAISTAIHVGLMFGVSGRVMSEGVGRHHQRAREIMEVTRDDVAEPPVSIDEILDLEAIREEPAETSELNVDGGEVVEMPAEISADAGRMVDSVPNAVFDSAGVAPRIEEPVGIGADPGLKRIDRIRDTGAPRVLDSPLSDLPIRVPEKATASSVKPVAAGIGEVRIAAPAIEKKPEIFSAPRPMVDFNPVDTVYDRVDEKTVEKEKAAVNELVEAEDAAPLEKFVNVTLTKFTAGGWTYFRMLMTPRSSLPIVPKDFVVLIDGSGSIGDDRLVSCRKAAKRILRSAMNTGDRFNLVVFRRNYEYAFRSWQPCTKASFAAADRWLANLAAHGRTDVFSTISSVLTLPRSPKRPLIALMVTDGEANEGVKDNDSLIENFTILNGGLVSVYMYGVKSSANRELLDRLTRSNRGENFVFEGSRWKAGDGIEGLSERFRDPVVSDLKVVFAADARAETYPAFLKNLYLGDTVELIGRVPAAVRRTSFSVRGIAGAKAYEGYFKLDFPQISDDPSLPVDYRAARAR